MFESKYSNFLTILLVIIIIAVIGLIGYFSYSVYKDYKTAQEANEFVNTFTSTENNGTINSNDNNGTDVELSDEQNNSLNNVEQVETSSSGTTTKTYQGYNVIGTIEIPKIELSYPILEKVSKSSIEVSVAMLYGPGPNQPGNTLIIGHNYRNGLFFANNKNLSIGDKIYITDLSGTKLTYTIYDKFETSENDTTFITRDTNGAREISLQTCTDDGNARLIIVAKCDLDS